LSDSFILSASGLFGLKWLSGTSSNFHFVAFKEGRFPNRLSSVLTYLAA
jgi:hypothetical protein